MRGEGAVCPCPSVPHLSRMEVSVSGLMDADMAVKPTTSMNTTDTSGKDSGSTCNAMGDAGENENG